MNLQSSLKIKVDVAKVWAVIIDIEHWVDWNPTIFRINKLTPGDIAVGTKFKVEQPNMAPAVWTVTSIIPHKEFKWETSTPGMRMKAAHLLESNGSETGSIGQLETTGIISFLLAPIIQPVAQKSIDAENAALKAFCETVDTH